MKLVFYFLLLLSLIQISQQQQQQQQQQTSINIYINNSGNDNNGDGSMNSPYQTICKLNQVLNNSTIVSINTITINIAYGEYYNINKPCIIEIININNLIMIPYGNENESGSGSSSNNNNGKNIQKVNIKYINFNIINSTLTINELNISISNNESNSKILDNGLTINNSSVIFSNIEFNLSSNSNEIYNNVVINSSFKILNSILIFNENNRKLKIQESTIEILQNSFIKELSIINLSFGKSFDLIINESMVLNCGFKSYYGNIKINNSILKRDSLSELIMIDLNMLGKLSIINSTILSNVLISDTNDHYSILTTSGSVIVYLENIIFSNFKNFNFLLYLTSGDIIINGITFKNCETGSLISIDPWLVTKLVISIDGLNLINNKCKGIIHLVSYSNITITNIAARCDKNFFINGILPPLFIMSSNLLYQFEQKSNISVSNSNLECFGSTLFINSMIQYENVIFSKSTFSGDFISLFHNSHFNLVSSSIFNIYNIEQTGYFFNLNDNSSINVSNCFINEIASPFIYAFNQSSIFISNLNFNGTRSNSISFINIEYNSELIMDNCNFSQYYGSYGSALINVENNSTSIINSISINKSWFEFCSFLRIAESQLTIKSLSMNNCFSNNPIFYIVGSSFGLYNSNFTNINSVTTSTEMFFIYGGNIEIVNCQFISNSFQPFIESQVSKFKFINILYKKNTGSFFFGDRLELVEFTSFKMYDNNYISNNYFIDIQRTKSVIFNQIEFVNNLFSNFIISSLECSVEFNDMLFINNIANRDYNLISYSEYEYDYGYGQFQFTSSNCTFNNLTVFENTIAANLFTMEFSNVFIIASNISSNVIKSNSTLFETTNSNLQFKNNEIIGNTAIYSGLQDNTKGIIVGLDSNIIIDSCHMKFNQFALSRGCIASFKLSNNDTNSSSDDDPFYFFILNSTIKGNVGDYGGVLFIDLQYSLGFQMPQLELHGNTFSDNYAKHAGGVVYTSNFAFSSNMNDTYQDNSFSYNTCSSKGISNDFSSLLKGLWSNNSQLYYESQTIQYSFVDYYDNIIEDIYGYYQLSVTCGNSTKNTGKKLNYTSLVIGGNGTFVWGNENECIDEIVISVLDVLDISSKQFKLNGCYEFKYLNGTNQCQYCQIGWTLPTDGKYEYQCYRCNPNKQTCVESSVFAFNGYYLGNKEPFECAIDMCKQNNQCPSNYYTGDLCFHCVDINGDNVVTKNGIQCCSHIKPWLIIPILVIIIIFSLLLSIGKYKFIIPGYSFIISIIIFLQINSVVFFSYRLYFLPLFRLSIDMFDGYCLWSNLNYNFKSFIIFIIIFISFAISSSDITLRFINTIYYPIIKRILPNSKLSIQSKFIKKLNIVNNSNNNTYKIRSIWSLFQVYIIPLLFNSISLLIYRNYPGSNTKVLVIDFSIVQFGNGETKFFYSISLIILSIVSMILVISIIIMVVQHGRFKNLKNIVKNTNYSNSNSTNIRKFCNWDQVNIIRSYLFIVLSLTMIFNTTYYLLIIVTIQIVYTISFFLFNPFKKKYSNQHPITNLINLFQLIIFVVSDSDIFQLLDPFYKGLTITCCSFFIVIFILFYNYSLKQRYSNSSNLKIK